MPCEASPGLVWRWRRRDASWLWLGNVKARPTPSKAQSLLVSYCLDIQDLVELSQEHHGCYIVEKSQLLACSSVGRA